MRYTIGSEIFDKKTKEKFSGLYVIGNYGFASILTDKNDVIKYNKRNGLQSAFKAVYDEITEIKTTDKEEFIAEVTERINKNYKIEEETPYDILVFNTIEEAQLYCQILARSYRRDDVWHSPSLKSKKIRRFYPVKIDSSNFPYKIKERIITKERRRDKNYITRNRFNEKQDTSLGQYSYYTICRLKN